jgi:putative phage-type endonuclease
VTAVELLPPGTGPHDERWHELRRAGVTASEIAAVMGLSPWQSPFSLFWSKTYAWDGGDNEFMSAGRHLEDGIADWWMAEHDPLENLVMCRAGLYAHPDRPWQLATPDRLICDPQTHDDPFPDDPEFEWRHPNSNVWALLECKWVAQSWDGWGESGTDEIPVYYRAQVLWQADVMGVDEVNVAALGPGGFRAYRVRIDEQAETDLVLMRAAGLEFQQRVESGDAPDLDGHTATIGALQKLYPDVGQGDVEVPLELAEAYRQARADRKDAEQRVAECEARIRAALASEYSRAVCNKKLVASRSVFERTAADEDELHALDDGFPITDRLNPGRAASYL